MSDEYATVAERNRERHRELRQEAITRALDGLQEAARYTSLTDEPAAYQGLQKTYFKLVAMSKALDPEWPAHDIDGTDYNLSWGDCRTLDTMQVCDPSNPTTDHYVSLDHVIEPDGDGGVRVAFEVNGVALDDVGTEPGSHIR